jgi:hypothetical protein
LKIAYGDLVKYISKTYFNWNGEKDEIGRGILQKVGTDIIRAKEPNYWVNFVIEFVYLFEDDFDYAIIDDCRFKNEIVQWINKGWDTYSIKVTRLNHKSKLNEEQLAHPSENDLNDYIFDYYIESPSGLDNLEIEIDKIFKNILY